MPIPPPATGAVDLPAPLLATAACPHDVHTSLRDRGAHRRDGGWVVARPEDVAAVLTSPTMTVAAPDPAPGDAAVLRALMARFSDGPAHHRRRALAEQLLTAAGDPGTDARARTTAEMRSRSGSVDVMPLARAVPVAVLAAALGVPERDVPEVVAAVGGLCDALAPWLVPPSPAPDGDAAATRLRELLRPVVGDRPEVVAAAAGLLFQARDATAALIGATLLGGGTGDVGERIERTLRADAPVQSTRRVATEDTVVGGVTVPGGAPVWVVLGAADRGRAAPAAAFGAGPHTCPGAGSAVALARGVLTALQDDGWLPVPGQEPGFEPRSNLRVPTRVLVRRP